MINGGSADPANSFVWYPRPPLEDVKLLPINSILYCGLGVTVGSGGDVGSGVEIEAQALATKANIRKVVNNLLEPSICPPRYSSSTTATLGRSFLIAHLQPSILMEKD
jgi:hypothetical protein